MAKKARPLNGIVDLLMETYSPRSKYSRDDAENFKNREGLVLTEGLTYDTFIKAYADGETVSFTYVIGTERKFFTEKTDKWNADLPITFHDEDNGNVLTEVSVKYETTSVFEGEVVGVGKLPVKRYDSPTYDSGDFYVVLSKVSHIEHNYNAGWSTSERLVRVECVSGVLKVVKKS